MKLIGLALCAALAVCACSAESTSSASVNLPTGSVPPATTVSADAAASWLAANAAPYVKVHHRNVGIIVADTIDAHDELQMAVQIVGGRQNLVVSCGFGHGLALVYRPGDLITWHWNDVCNDYQFGDLSLLKAGVVGP